MSGHVAMSVDDDGIATVVMDRAEARVNALEPEFGGALFGTLRRAATDEAVRAIVITSAKADFLVGADVAWLSRVEDDRAIVRSLEEVHAALAALEEVASGGRPVIAAIHGACLGAGLELALACSHRVVSDDEARTQLGLPEVRLGVIPGAAGTQRLPRIIGLVGALDLILTGRTVRPRRARAMGLVDDVVPREHLLAAARELAGGGNRRRRSTGGAVARRLALESNPVGRRIVFAKAQRRVDSETRGNYPAPPAALRAVRAGVEHGFAEGSRAELDEFAKLVVTPEAKALMSIFTATRELKEAHPLAEGARKASVVGIVGGGLMGSGIAAVTVLEARTPTRIKEVSREAGTGAVAAVSELVSEVAARRRLSPSETARVRHLVTSGTTWAGFEKCDVVIEAVFEERALKQEVLAEFEAAAGPGSVFASNTSSIPIGSIAADSAHPSRVIGMHYFSPVERMPLLEVIATDETAASTLSIACDLGRRQGKTVIVVGDGPGFYTTRILAPYANEALRILQEGASIAAVDDAMEAFGFPVGPFKLLDEVGMDVAWKISRVLTEAFGERMRPPDSLDGLVGAGHMGRKNERGMYRYVAGERRHPDPDVESSVRTADRDIGAAEIRDRLVFAMVNEAVRCLDDGVLHSARDGDVGAVLGLGFPPYTGGPFTHVDRVGADRALELLVALSERHGDRFSPAGGLVEAAATGQRFRREALA